MYPIDLYPAGVASAADTCVTHPFREFYNTSYHLSHLDVLHNIGPSRPICDTCSTPFLPRQRRACDGTYPSAVSSLWPEGSLGRQFQCFRGQLCKSCEVKVPGKHWLCKFCTAPPSSHADVWGQEIKHPPYL